MLDTGNFNLFSADAVGLYNGNIAALSTATDSVTPLLKSFRYDKLNRIKRMQTAGISAGEWGSLTDNFSTEYRYDYNGNILSLQRKDATAQIMHRINYTYNAKNNRLQAITATGINSSNYSYDAIGNLSDDSGESVSVTWNAMNKVKTVTTSNNNLSFSYSPTGQRQIKKTGDKTEYYLHDATGNIMCIYELSGKYLTVKERTIYGSKRIGVYRQRIQLGYSGITGGGVLLPGSGLIGVLHPSPILPPVGGRLYLQGSNRLQVIGVVRTTLSVNTLAYKKGTIELKGFSPSIATRPTFLDGTKTAGLRDYELTDHLSNVMAVISDRKLSVDTNSDTITDYYAPQVVSFTDYYPFGFPMAERSGNISWYRFGFNGKEDDNEIYMIGAMQNYGFRMYDTRIAKFWGVDPITKEYPMLTPFQFASNSPIWYIDRDGLEGVENTTEKLENGITITYNNARQSTYVPPVEQPQPLKPPRLVLPTLPIPNTGEIRVAKSDFEKAWEFSAGPFANYLRYDPVIKSIAVGGLAITSYASITSLATSSISTQNLQFVFNARNAATGIVLNPKVQFSTGFVMGYFGKDIFTPDFSTGVFPLDAGLQSGSLFRYYMDTKILQNKNDTINNEKNNSKKGF